MTTALDKGPCFMAPVLDGVKASCPKSSGVKRPWFVRTRAVPMTMARIFRSGGKRKFHAPVRHEARSSNGIDPLSAIGE